MYFTGGNCVKFCLRLIWVPRHSGGSGGDGSPGPPLTLKVEAPDYILRPKLHFYTQKKKKKNILKTFLPAFTWHTTYFGQKPYKIFSNLAILGVIFNLYMVMLFKFLTFHNDIVLL